MQYLFVNRIERLPNELPADAQAKQQGDPALGSKQRLGGPFPLASRGQTKQPEAAERHPQQRPDGLGDVVDGGKDVGAPRLEQQPGEESAVEKKYQSEACPDEFPG